MKQLTRYIVLLLSMICLLSADAHSKQLLSSENAYKEMNDNKNKLTPDEESVMQTIRRFAELKSNYRNRNITNNFSHDTLDGVDVKQYTKEETLREMLNLVKELTSKRKELVQLSAKNIAYQLSVERVDYDFIRRTRVMLPRFVDKYKPENAYQLVTSLLSYALPGDIGFAEEKAEVALVNELRDCLKDEVSEAMQMEEQISAVALAANLIESRYYPLTYDTFLPLVKDADDRFYLYMHQLNSHYNNEIQKWWRAWVYEGDDDALSKLKRDAEKFENLFVQYAKEATGTDYANLLTYTNRALFSPLGSLNQKTSSFTKEDLGRSKKNYFDLYALDFSEPILESYRLSDKGKHGQHFNKEGDIIESAKTSILWKNKRLAIYKSEVATHTPKPGVYKIALLRKAAGLQEDPSMSLVDYSWEISDMTAVLLGLGNPHCIYLHNNLTNKPVAKHPVVVSEYNSQINKTVYTDENGIVKLPFQRSWQRVEIVSPSFASGKQTFDVPPLSHSDFRLEIEKAYALYTDRPIYQPGQTIHLAIVSGKVYGKSRVVVPKRSGVAELTAYKDGKLETLDAKKFKTDGHGLSQLTFDLPESTDYDGFEIAIKDSHAAIHPQVEEYKLNYLTLKLDSLPGGLMFGEEATLLGTTEDFNGTPIGAKLRMTTMDGQIFVTESDQQSGKFALKFALEPSGREKFWPYAPELKKETDEEKDKVSEFVRLELIGTDPLGNIESLTRSGLVNSESPLTLQMSVNSQLGKDSVKVSVRKYEPFASTGAPVEVKLYIAKEEKKAGGKTQRELLKTFKSGEEITLDLSQYASAPYQFIAKAEDANGKSVEDSQTVLLFGLQEENVPEGQLLWFYNEKSNIQVGQSYRFRVGSSYDGIMNVLIRKKDGDIVFSKQYETDGKVIDVEVPVSSLPIGDYHVNLCQNSYHARKTYSFSFYVEDPKQTYSIEPEGGEIKQGVPSKLFRQRFQVKRNDGEPQTNMPVIVTVYDMSVDKQAYSPMTWNKASVELLNSNARNRNLMQEDIAISAAPTSLRTYSTAKVENAIQMVDMDGFSGKAMKQSETNESVEAGGGMEDSEDNMRSNFAETAYFTTTLVTDEKGYVTVEFTLPDVETKYVVRMVSFSNDLDKEATAEYTINSQLPLSITVGLPRSFVSGDEVDIPLMIKNKLSETKDVTYVLKESGQLIGERSSRLSGMFNLNDHFRFTVPNKDSVEISASLYDARQSLLIDDMVKSYPVYPIEILYRTAQPVKGLEKGSVRLREIEHNGEAKYGQLEFYLSPLHLLLSQLAMDYVSMDPIEEMYLLSVVDRYVTYRSLELFLEENPKVVAELKQSLSYLSKINVAEEGDKMNRRLASITTYKRFYKFLTQPNELSSFVERLAKRIKSEEYKGGGFGYNNREASPILTLFVLARMDALKMEEHLPVLVELFPRAFELIEQKAKETSHINLLQYRLIRHNLYARAKGDLPKEMKEQLKKQLEWYGKNYSTVWTSSLITYADYLKQFETAKWAPIHKLIKDRADYTKSDRERVLFETYLYRDVDEIPDEVLKFLLEHKGATIWDDPITFEAIKMLLARLEPTRFEKNAALDIEGYGAYKLTALDKALGHLVVPMEGMELYGKQLELKGVQTPIVLGGYMQYLLEPRHTIAPQGKELTVKKEIVYIENEASEAGKMVAKNALTPEGMPAKTKVIVRYIVDAEQDLSLVQIRDNRPAGLEFGTDFRGFSFGDRAWWYYRRLNTTDIIQIDYLPKGKHVFELTSTSPFEGKFHFGPANVVSIYAPEFAGNSSGGVLYVK